MRTLHYMFVALGVLVLAVAAAVLYLGRHEETSLPNPPNDPPVPDMLPEEVTPSPVMELDYPALWAADSRVKLVGGVDDRRGVGVRGRLGAVVRRIRFRATIGSDHHGEVVDGFVTRCSQQARGAGAANLGDSFTPDGQPPPASRLLAYALEWGSGQFIVSVAADDGKAFGDEPLVVTPGGSGWGPGGGSTRLVEKPIRDAVVEIWVVENVVKNR